ncbi:MAG TPA: phosphotransferase [Streptosporangiaceae bacterium]|nr:phosphotransferase [Streptosporangiaceae bacterium]
MSDSSPNVFTGRSAEGRPPPHTPPVWAPERVVSADEAAELIGEQFAGLRGAPIEPLSTGWDNTVHLVDGTWVFRFPRRAFALPGVAREIAALPVLAPRLPLPVPVPELVGRPTRRFPWPFWGGLLVPGAELAEAGLSNAARVGVARGVGAFLRALHDPGLVAKVEGAELPRDPMRRGDPGVRAPGAREALARLDEQGVRAVDPALDRFLAAAADAPAPSGADVICHGDLHVRHVLVAGDGTAIGVIDWGDLCLGDPVVDLSLAYSAFAGPARAAFLSAYGRPVDADREVAARVLAVNLSTALAVYAADIGDARLLAESLAGIDRVLAD